MKTKLQNGRTLVRRSAPPVVPVLNNVIRMFSTRAEAALQLSLSVRSLDRLIGTGGLKARLIGGRVLVPHIELTRAARNRL